MARHGALERGPVIMRTIVGLVTSCMVVLGVGCAASLPPPTQRLADAQSAQRSAQELGAVNQPEAQLHLRLAAEQSALVDSQHATDQLNTVRTVNASQGAQQ